MRRYTLSKQISLDFDTALARATEALADVGFGILTEIDVATTLKKKLDLDVPPYRILGACNPQFASQALALEPEIGALLPCNVVVRQDSAGAVHVDIMDPSAVLGLVDRPEIKPIADQVRSLLTKVLEAL